MLLSVLLAAGGDGPGGTAGTDETNGTSGTNGPDEAPTLQDAQQTATDAAGWVEENWSTWLSIGLRVLLILVIAITLRHFIRKTITKAITRMNRGADAVDGTGLSGLLVNAERRRQRSEAIGSVLRSVTTFLIMGTAALMILGTFEINLAPLLASAGVAGIALGFGARNLVTDFLSGVFMILEDQYGVGDSIDAGVAVGEVVEVGLRVTKLRGENGAIWYVRNGEVKRIANRSQGWATAHVDVTVRPDEDLGRLRTILTEVGTDLAKDEPWNEELWGPVEVLGLDSVTLDAMVLHVSAKTMPGKATGIERELRWRIKVALDAAGIRMVGDAPAAGEDDDNPAEPSGTAPSAYASANSPQSVAASPIPAPAPASAPAQHLGRP
nr:mechanosensitive ion channel family protein [Streptomyces apocyni]